MTSLARHRLLPRSIRFLKRAGWLICADAVILVIIYGTLYSVHIASIPTTLDTKQGLFLVRAVAIMLAAMFLFGGYHRIWTRTSGHDVKVIIAAVHVSALVTILVELMQDPRPVPISVVLVANFIALAGFAAIRYQTRLISGLLWRWRAVWHYQFPRPDVRVLIVGAGDAGQITAFRLKYRAPNDQHYHVVGFVDDDPAKQHLFIEGCRVLGTRTDIPRLISELAVELIVVAIHNISGPQIRDILDYCERTSARIKIIPDIFAVIEGSNGAPLLRDVRAEDLLGRQTVEWHEGVDVSPIANRTVLVTGAAGSIGSEICRQLLKYNLGKLILLDNNESGLYDLVAELSDESNDDRLVPFLGDITQRPAVAQLFMKYRPHVVFHSAAYKHVPVLEHFPNEAIRVNIGGTQQIAGLARDYGAERFVLISTDKAVNPTCVMGASKRICELLMHAFSQQGTHDTLFTSVRFGNVLGSRGSVVPLFNRQIDSGGPVTVTDPAMTRYFMTIPEAANLVVHAACLTKGDDLFMLRMGEVVRITDLAERMIRLRGLVPHKDIMITYSGKRPGEKLHEELSCEDETEILTPHPAIIELSSNKNGFQPISFSDRVTNLFRYGINEENEPLAQLSEIIALGEGNHPSLAQEGAAQAIGQFTLGEEA